MKQHVARRLYTSSTSASTCCRRCALKFSIDVCDCTIYWEIINLFAMLFGFVFVMFRFEGVVNWHVFVAWVSNIRAREEYCFFVVFVCEKSVNNCFFFVLFFLFSFKVAKKDWRLAQFGWIFIYFNYYYWLQNKFSILVQVLNGFFFKKNIYILRNWTMKRALFRRDFTNQSSNQSLP